MDFYLQTVSKHPSPSSRSRGPSRALSVPETSYRNLPFPLRDRTRHDDPFVLSARMEECPWCGAHYPRRDITLIEIGLRWNRVRCPRCKQIFGVKVR